MNTQKVYTFPKRELYGEFDLIGIIELRIKIVKGEIKQRLCLIDSSDRAACFDSSSVLDFHSPEFLEERYRLLLCELLKAQMKSLKNK